MPRNHLRHHITDDFGEQHEYTITLFGGVEATRLLRRLACIVMPTLTRGVGAIKGQGGLLGMELEGGELSAAVQHLLDSIVEHGEIEFLLKILEHVTRDGKKLDRLHYDQAFQGNVGEMMHAVYWAIESNFGNFFRSRMRPLLNRIQVRMSEQASEPKNESESPSSSQIQALNG